MVLTFPDTMEKCNDVTTSRARRGASCCANSSYRRVPPPMKQAPLRAVRPRHHHHVNQTCNRSTPTYRKHIEIKPPCLKRPNTSLPAIYTCSAEWRTTSFSSICFARTSPCLRKRFLKVVTSARSNRIDESCAPTLATSCLSCSRCLGSKQPPTLPRAELQGFGCTPIREQQKQCWSCTHGRVT